MIPLLLACGAVDPDLRAKREAVDAFERAKAQLEAGDAVGARRAFAALPEVHPIVAAWEARAAARSGDIEGAVTTLGTLLEEHPTLGVARYNRAAYLARLGRLDEAGRDLQVAIELGAADVRQAMADADFAPHLEHPALRFLVANALIVAVEPLRHRPSSAVRYGSRCD